MQKDPLLQKLSDVYDGVKEHNDKCFGMQEDKQVEWAAYKVYVNSVIDEVIEDDETKLNVLKTLTVALYGFGHKNEQSPLKVDYDRAKVEYEIVKKRMGIDTKY